MATTTWWWSGRSWVWNYVVWWWRGSCQSVVRNDSFNSSNIYFPIEWAIHFMKLFLFKDGFIFSNIIACDYCFWLSIWRNLFCVKTFLQAYALSTFSHTKTKVMKVVKQCYNYLSSCETCTAKICKMLQQFIELYILTCNIFSIIIVILTWDTFSKKDSKHDQNLCFI